MSSVRELEHLILSAGGYLEHRSQDISGKCLKPIFVKKQTCVNTHSPLSRRWSQRYYTYSSLLDCWSLSFVCRKHRSS